MLNQPIIQSVGQTTGNKREYTLCEDYHINGVTIPKGFISDLASVPGFLRGVVNDNGLIDGPAIKHDWDWYNGVDFNKSNAVMAFNLSQAGVSPIARKLIMLGLNSFIARWRWKRRWKQIKREGVQLKLFKN